MRRCVSSRSLKNKEAMTRVGSQRHRKKGIYDDNQWTPGATGVKFGAKKEFKNDFIFCRNCFMPMITNMADVCNHNVMSTNLTYLNTNLFLKQKL